VVVTFDVNVFGCDIRFAASTKELPDTPPCRTRRVDLESDSMVLRGVVMRRQENTPDSVAARKWRPRPNRADYLLMPYFFILL
jgi:hypothetical protein